jgi:hypothetical protein
MTTMTPTEAATSRRVPVILRVGAVLAVILALVDLVGTITYWQYAPVPINIAYLVISAITIVGAVLAWRGSTAGIWMIAITRFLSIVLSLPVFLDSGAPPEAIAPSAIQDVVTVVAIVLVLIGLARRPRA